ncbi:MAG: hypothetical protein ACE10E_15035, partial [Acidiferrobacterales bacterium]
MASPFDGMTVHWTVIFARVTPVPGLDARNPFRARSGPNFAFFASLSCIARKTGVRHPWRTRSPGRRFTGSPPFIRLAHRRLA